MAREHKPKAEPTIIRFPATTNLATYKPPPDYGSLHFDYSQINENHRQKVMDLALEIRHRLKRSMEDMIAIGRHLDAVKALLLHGQYHDWLRDEFGMSVGSASEHRSIAARFEGKLSIIESLTPTTARLLSVATVPDEAIAAVVEASQETGKPLPVREVKAILKAYAPPPPALPPPAIAYAPLEPEVDDDVIDVEYQVMVDVALQEHNLLIKRAIDELGQGHDTVLLAMPRALAAKLRDALLHRLLKAFLTPEESDQLLLSLGRALDSHK